MKLWGHKTLNRDLGMKEVEILINKVEEYFHVSDSRLI